MSLPGIFRRLFGNEGAGPKLLPEIIPPHADTHGEQGSDPITPESIGAMAANAKPGSASSADVAVKLKTSRAIDGMGFDGTKNIIHYAVCSTAAATAAKTVNLTGFVLGIGARILVRFDTTNTAEAPTLNVTGTGAKAIRYKNATVTASVLAAKAIREFVYDGAYWQIVGDLDSNTTYGAASTSKAGIVQLSSAVNSTSETQAATSKAVKEAYDKADAATFPKGTRLLFHQAAAPTGWTKQTTINDAALRVVSGTTGGDTGGSLAFSTLFAAGKAVTLSGNVGATTLTANQGPLHDHEMAGNTGTEDPTMYRFYANFSAGAPKRGDENNKYPFTCLSVLYSGGSQPHSHALSGSAKIALNVKYTDVIICAKA